LFRFIFYMLIIDLLQDVIRFKVPNSIILKRYFFVLKSTSTFSFDNCFCRIIVTILFICKKLYMLYDWLMIWMFYVFHDYSTNWLFHSSVFRRIKHLWFKVLWICLYFDIDCYIFCIAIMIIDCFLLRYYYKAPFIIKGDETWYSSHLFYSVKCTKLFSTEVKWCDWTLLTGD